MIPTPTGLLFALFGFYLLTRPPIAMMVFVLVCTLFPAASAVDLPALGGSSIPPALMGLGFLALRILKKDVLRSAGPQLSLEKNAWLLVFCIYCAATAWVLPRLFAGRIDLIPMGAAGSGFQPLHVTAQNTTQAVYMLGTAFAAVAATILATRYGSPLIVIKAMVVITWVHALSGVADLLFSAAHISGAFDIVRTGAYAQLDQGENGFHRISGMCPEPSVYAALGAAYFAFMSELWLRRILPRRTGPAALVMLCMILLSTSSSAYVAVAAYVLVLVARVLIVPASMTIDRAIILMAVSVLGLLAVLTILLINPREASNFGQVLANMTIKKQQSSSGLERGLWAKQGWDAMKVSKGLGVGVGSFRSSSIVSAIVGAVGPAGLAVFFGYCLQVFKFGRKSSYAVTNDIRSAAGAAAAWTALIALVPALFTWASADPGLIFAMMAGLSLGWRTHVVAAPTKREFRQAATKQTPVAA